MSLVQILTIMQALWNNEYVDMNDHNKSFYDDDLHTLHCRIVKILRLLHPAEREHVVWAAKAWEDHRAMLRSLPRAVTKSTLMDEQIHEREYQVKRMQLEREINKARREARESLFNPSEIIPIKKTPSGFFERLFKSI